MGKKKHKNKPVNSKQAEVQAENAKVTTEQSVEETQPMQDAQVQEEILKTAEEPAEVKGEGSSGQIEEVAQETEDPEDAGLQGQEEKAQDEIPEAEVQMEVSSQGSEVQAEVIQQDDTVEESEAPKTEEALEPDVQEQTESEAPEPVVQIKEWQESAAVGTSTEALTAEDEKTEKKTKILMWAGIAMLVIVVVAGIAIGFAGKEGESKPVSSGQVVTPTVAANVSDEKVPTEAAGKAGEASEPLAGTPTESVKPSSTPIPTLESTKAPTSTPTLTTEPTEAPTLTPTPTKGPSATPTPEPTKAPTITPTPVVVGDIDVSKYAVYSTKGEGWGIGRNTEHKQPTAWGYDEKYKFDEIDAYYVDKNATEEDKVIYLTFNCGYEVGYTPGFLEVLKKHDVKATFFVLEEYIRQCPEEIRWLMENGHLVGSHSAYHLDYRDAEKNPPEKIIKDMLFNEQRMRDYVGLEMDKVMRPPSGYYSEQALRIMKDLGYKIYFWSLAYPDWDPNDQWSEERILEYFKANHHNGAIPVMHITSGTGMKVLDEVITMLKAEGYRFGLVSEIE